MTSRLRAREVIARILTLLLLMTVVAPAAAQETISYTYDARGRLVKVDHGTSGPNANVLSTYTYDGADNRCDQIIRTNHTSATGSCPRAGILTLSPSALPSGSVGTGYASTISASGGTSPYTYAVTSGAVPSGLALSSGGVLSGTPVGAGTSNFTITATDSVSNTGSRAYSLTVNAVALALSPTTLPNGTVGTAYSQTISASGGSGGYSYSVSAGTLPAGLSLNSSTGVISGTPTTATSYSFTIKATDSSSNTGTQAYNVTIASGVQGPVANPDYASTTACGSVTTNVVANDTDSGGNYPLQVTAIVSSTKGTASIVSSTSVEFDASVASGTGVVTYTVANTKGATANGTLTVTISGGVCP